MDIKNKLVISTVTAFVSVDKDGNEGIIGQLTNAGWMPFVCADEERIKSLLPLAVDLEKATGIPFRILQFSTKEDVTIKYKMNLYEQWNQPSKR